MGIPEWLRWERGHWRALSDFAVWPWQQSILSGPPHGSGGRHTFSKSASLLWATKFYLEISDFQLAVWYQISFLVWSLKKKSGKASLCSADWLKCSKVTFIGLQTWKRKKNKNNNQEKTKAENNYVRSEGEELQLADKKKRGRFRR